MADDFLRYSLRVDKGLFQKFRYVSEYMGRSANSEIIQLIKRRVKEFESKHGEIETGKEP